MNSDKIRNFCIIAHIDHGKSTLADRMLQLTDTVTDREFRDQILDDMDLERERGITIKSHSATMKYKAANGEVYELNLIDTPGHVDFSYEVSRSMAACDGAILIVDAAQGVEAQTVANMHLAEEHGLTVIPVINKIDLPNADADKVAKQIEDILAIEAEDCIRASAKTGVGVADILEIIVQKMPPPKGDPKKENTRALIFDSVYDTFRGVVIYVRVVDGEIKAGDKVHLVRTDYTTEIKEVGIFTPQQEKTEKLGVGQVGYIIGTIKKASDVKIGDTVKMNNRVEVESLPGFKEVKSMVFSGFYPVDTSEYEKFRICLEKMTLNDSSITYHPESSAALGFGFRCGFLGLLHMEVVQERFSREFDLSLVTTHPSVVYKVYMRSGEIIDLDNPIDLPDITMIEHIEEPMIRAYIICRNNDIGDIMKLIMEKRGEVSKTDSIDTTRVMLTCSMPLNEILTDFYDKLKSVSRGYASMDYEYMGYLTNDIVKLDVMLNAEVIDAFSCMVHRSKAVTRGRQICKALKEEIPPHQFTVPIQAAINKNIVARENIKAYRKDVTAKLYGGDITRKRKVLERQKKGKKRMKQFGTVSVPQKAFVSVLKTD